MTTQPTGPAQPPTYLVWAILSTILCCLPLGVVSIVYAARVATRWERGDLAGAERCSERALRFAVASAVAGVVLVLLILFGVIPVVNAG